MENFMDYCISLNSIKGFVISHRIEVLTTYLAVAWAFGLMVTRKEFSDVSELDADGAIWCFFQFMISPIWVPFLLIWSILDPSGRRLREKNKK